MAWPSWIVDLFVGGALALVSAILTRHAWLALGAALSCSFLVHVFFSRDLLDPVPFLRRFLGILAALALVFAVDAVLHIQVVR